MWLEQGPNSAPIFTELRLDWSVKTFAELGVAHGDVLLVQEHHSRMPHNWSGTSKFFTGPDWIDKRIAMAANPLKGKGYGVLY